MALKVNVIPDLPNTIPVIIASIILFLIFRYFMWDKVKNMLDKRADLVVSNLKESEEAKKASIVLKEEYEQKLQEAKDEASKIISNARQYSEELKSNAIKESKEEAKREYGKGIKALELEKRKVLSAVNDDIVDLAMLTAEKVLNKSADSKIDKNMVREFVNNLEASNE